MVRTAYGGENKESFMTTGLQIPVNRELVHNCSDFGVRSRSVLSWLHYYQTYSDRKEAAADNILCDEQHLFPSHSGESERNIRFGTVANCPYYQRGGEEALLLHTITSFYISAIFDTSVDNT